MPRAKTPTERAERNAEIVRRYDGGWSMGMLAKAHDLNISRIHDIVTTAGGPIRARGAVRGTPSMPRSWKTPLPPRLPWRAEIEERLRALRAGEV